MSEFIVETVDNGFIVECEGVKTVFESYETTVEMYELLLASLIDYVNDGEHFLFKVKVDIEALE